MSLNASTSDSQKYQMFNKVQTIKLDLLKIVDTLDTPVATTTRPTFLLIADALQLARRENDLQGHMFIMLQNDIMNLLTSVCDKLFLLQGVIPKDPSVPHRSKEFSVCATATRDSFENTCRIAEHALPDNPEYLSRSSDKLDNVNDQCDANSTSTEPKPMLTQRVPDVQKQPEPQAEKHSPSTHGSGNINSAISFPAEPRSGTWDKISSPTNGKYCLHHRTRGHNTAECNIILNSNKLRKVFHSPFTQARGHTPQTVNTTTAQPRSKEIQRQSTSRALCFPRQLFTTPSAPKLNHWCVLPHKDSESTAAHCTYDREICTNIRSCNVDIFDLNSVLQFTVTEMGDTTISPLDKVTGRVIRRITATDVLISTFFPSHIFSESKLLKQNNCTKVQSQTSWQYFTPSGQALLHASQPFLNGDQSRVAQLFFIEMAPANNKTMFTQPHHQTSPGFISSAERDKTSTSSSTQCRQDNQRRTSKRQQSIKESRPTAKFDLQQRAKWQPTTTTCAARSNVCSRSPHKQRGNQRHPALPIETCPAAARSNNVPSDNPEPHKQRINPSQPSITSSVCSPTLHDACTSALPTRVPHPLCVPHALPISCSSPAVATGPALVPAISNSTDVISPVRPSSSFEPARRLFATPASPPTLPSPPIFSSASSACTPSAPRVYNIDEADTAKPATANNVLVSDIAPAIRKTSPTRLGDMVNAALVFYNNIDAKRKTHGLQQHDQQSRSTASRVNKVTSGSPLNFKRQVDRGQRQPATTTFPSSGKKLPTLKTQFWLRKLHGLQKHDHKSRSQKAQFISSAEQQRNVCDMSSTPARLPLSTLSRQIKQRPTLGAHATVMSGVSTSSQTFVTDPAPASPIARAAAVEPANNVVQHDNANTSTPFMSITALKDSSSEVAMPVLCTPGIRGARAPTHILGGCVRATAKAEPCTPFVLASSDDVPVSDTLAAQIVYLLWLRTMVAHLYVHFGCELWIRILVAHFGSAFLSADSI